MQEYWSWKEKLWVSALEKISLDELAVTELDLVSVEKHADDVIGEI